MVGLKPNRVINCTPADDFSGSKPRDRETETQLLKKKCLTEPFNPTMMSGRSASRSNRLF